MVAPDPSRRQIKPDSNNSHITTDGTPERGGSCQCPTKIHSPSISRNSRPCTSARKTSRPAPVSGALIAHPPRAGLSVRWLTHRGYYGKYINVLTPGRLRESARGQAGGRSASGRTACEAIDAHRGRKCRSRPTDRILVATRRRRGREISGSWPAGAGRPDEGCEWVRAAARIRRGGSAIDRRQYATQPDRTRCR